MPAAKSPERKLWDRVKVVESDPDACWEWQGSLLRRGYGSVGRIDGQSWQAHRLAWVLANGSIPPGLCVCHHCDNPRCVRPSHLFLGTRKENNDDKERKGRASHPQGEQHGWQRKPESRPMGEVNGMAKLTEDQVREIRSRAASGATFKGLAREYGVSDTQISWIVKRKSWQHI